MLPASLFPSLFPALLLPHLHAHALLLSCHGNNVLLKLREAGRARRRMNTCRLRLLVLFAHIPSHHQQLINSDTTHQPISAIISAVYSHNQQQRRHTSTRPRVIRFHQDPSSLELTSLSLYPSVVCRIAQVSFLVRGLVHQRLNAFAPSAHTLVPKV
jgi:hypothetical protein